MVFFPQKSVPHQQNCTLLNAALPGVTFSLCFCSCLEGRGYSFWSLKLNLKRKSKETTTVTGCEGVLSSIQTIHFVFFSLLLSEGKWGLVCQCFVRMILSSNTLLSSRTLSAPNTESNPQGQLDCRVSALQVSRKIKLRGTATLSNQQIHGPFSSVPSASWTGLNLSLVCVELAGQGRAHLMNRLCENCYVQCNSECISYSQENRWGPSPTSIIDNGEWYFIQNPRIFLCNFIFLRGKW